MTRDRQDPFRILLTSAGRRVGLVECLRQAGEELGLSVEIMACDLNPQLSAACAVADSSFAVPRCDDPAYADIVLDAAVRGGAQLVIPTIDPELLPLATAGSRFGSAGIHLHVSAPEVIEIVRDKLRTAEVLGCVGVPVPRSLTLEALRADPSSVDWPVFAKPVAGSASRGLAVFDRPADVPDAFIEPMVFQQRLAGPEFTVNVFIDRDGRLACAIPHRRLQIRAGEVEKGRTERRDDLGWIAERVAVALPGLRGAACFQVIADPKAGAMVIEVNARFGGGYPIAHHAGANFAKWLIEEALDLPSSANDRWEDGIEMLRYDAAIFRRKDDRLRS
jgi:carbamoyl-phosphate synthase large subunit